MDVPVEADRSNASPASMLTRVRTGDHAAFTALVVAHDADMVRLCLVICRDPDAARDAVQSAWQRLWSEPPRLRNELKLRSWLLSVAANESRQQLRRRRVGVVRELRSPSEPASTDPAVGIDRLDLDAALARLDPAERELFGLRYVLGMTSSREVERIVLDRAAAAEEAQDGLPMQHIGRLEDLIGCGGLCRARYGSGQDSLGFHRRS